MPLFELPNNVRDAWPSGARDFDFLEREWVIRDRRLRERLKGSNDWVEFETPMMMQPILGGLGNIDQCRITDGLSSKVFRCGCSTWPMACGASIGSIVRARVFFLPSLAVLTDPTECFEGKTATTANPFW
jgi:hypothetical protein